MEVDEVVFSMARWLRKIDLTLSKESNLQKPEKEIRFLRESRKETNLGLKENSSSKHTVEAESDSNSATQPLSD